MSDSDGGHWKGSEESSETADDQWPGQDPRQEAPAYLRV